jgi:hypothetical protein
VKRDTHSVCKRACVLDAVFGRLYIIVECALQYLNQVLYEASSTLVLCVRVPSMCYGARTGLVVQLGALGCAVRRLLCCTFPTRTEPSK